MKKDAYYFPHFSNARNDAKLTRLRRIFGWDGYGLYFALLEVLREQTNMSYPIEGLKDLAYDWHVGDEKLISIVNDFGLFTIDENNFFSTKLIEFMQPYLKSKEQRRNAAISRWAKDNLDNNNDATALRPHYDRTATEMQSKVKKSKVNKNIEYYNNQILINKESEHIKEYEIFFNMLIGKNKAEMPMTDLLSLQYQVSYTVFVDLLKESKKRDKKLTGILLKASNDDKYSKNKRSLPIIIMTWLESDFK